MQMRKHQSILGNAGKVLRQQLGNTAIRCKSKLTEMRNNDATTQPDAMVANGKCEKRRQ